MQIIVVNTLSFCRSNISFFFITDITSHKYKTIINYCAKHIDIHFISN